MSTLRIGTCSWKYDSWIGLIYKPDDKANYLKGYAGHYNTVEIDQWFWSLFPGKPPVLPKPETVNQYVDAVPDDFEFSIKVPNSITLTHYYNRNKSAPLQANPHFLSPDLFQQVLDRLSPMKDLLGPIMFQFEYLNKVKMPSLELFLTKLAAFFEKCPRNYRYGLEIRNPQYLNKTYFTFLREYQLGHVFLQGYYMPSIFNIFNQWSDWIRDWTVIRLHGPDRKGIESMTKGAWNTIVAAKDDELDQLHRMIEALLSKGVNITLNVNNHYEGSSPLTIERIRDRLQSD